MAPPVTRRQVYRGASAIELLEPGSRIAQPHTLPRSPLRATWPPAVVFQNQAQHPACTPRSERDEAAAIIGYAVLECVLDQRLEQEDGDSYVQDRGIDVEPDLELVPKAHPLDVQIVLEKRQLLAQRHLVSLLIETAAQQRRQPEQHLLRLLGVLVRQYRDGVQRIEQKVRPQLRPQRIQLAARQLPLGVGIQPAETKGREEHEQGPVVEHAHEEGPDLRRPEVAKPRKEHRSRQLPANESPQGLERQVDEVRYRRQQNGYDDVRQQLAPGHVEAEGPAIRHGEDKRREAGPDHPEGQLGEHAAQGHVMAGDLVHQHRLRGEEHAGEERERDDAPGPSVGGRHAQCMAFHRCPGNSEPLGTPAGPVILRMGSVGPFSLCVAWLPAYPGTMLLLLAALALAPSDTTMPAVAIPRYDDPAVIIDGRLDEAAWAGAAVLRGFSQYVPNDNRPAEDSTVVLAWYSSSAIYFGIRAWQDSASVRATVADRDNIVGDDYVQLVLDPLGDRRQALVFGVNPLGIQSDGTLRDAPRHSIDITSSAVTGAYTVDLNPDFVYSSKGRLTSWGYEIEIRIPFKSLRYQAREPQSWGINVIRVVQATGHQHTWTRVLQTRPSFLAQSGTLTGLSDLHRGLVPDFSQVEADVPQIQFNPRVALFFPEKRPFFLDGLELFNTPVQLIYTRRLVDPSAALKLTGQTGAMTIATLSGVDGTVASAGADHPLLNAVRLRRNIGGQNMLGIVYTDRVDGSSFNRVAAADGRVLLGHAWDLTVQSGASATRDAAAGPVRWAPMWKAVLIRSGRHFGLNVQTYGVHGDFQASSGFLASSGFISNSVIR